LLNFLYDLLSFRFFVMNSTMRRILLLLLTLWFATSSRAEFRALLDAAALPPSHRRDDRTRHVAFDRALRDRFALAASQLALAPRCRLRAPKRGAKLGIFLDFGERKRNNVSDDAPTTSSCADVLRLDDAEFADSKLRCHDDRLSTAATIAPSDVVADGVAALRRDGRRVDSVRDAAMVRFECADPAEWLVTDVRVDDELQRLQIDLRLARAVALVREQLSLRMVPVNGSSLVSSASLTRHRLNGASMTPFRLASWSTTTDDDHTAAVRSRSEHGTVRLLGFNVWNFDDGPEWKERVKLIARIINETRPDIVALQEVRVKLNNVNAKSQLDDIVALLGGAYPHFAYQSAMAHPQTFDEEGLGLVSRHPLEHDWAPLPAADSDLNKRIVLTTVSTVDGVPLVLANAHWTYDESAQLEQAYATVGNVHSRTPHTGAARIITGDFNLYVRPTPTPTEQFMEGKTRYLGTSGDYVDAWKARMGAGDPELMTFSPVKGWTARPDRFYVDKARCSTKSFALVGTTATRGRYPSDHAGILGVFECKR
jgi:endonuclease/exonuclease/phosphatase family metal-dependent hydrolase